MHVRVLAVGGRCQDWVDEAWRHYAKRLPPAWRFELVEIAGARRSPRQAAAEVRDAEAELIRRSLASEERVVALDERGASLDSEGLAARLQDWFGDGRDLAFVIGGADGLSPRFLDAADFRWSLSPLTFPHEVVRLLLAEQLYRAHTILTGHPYHRG